MQNLTVDQVEALLSAVKQGDEMQAAQCLAEINAQTKANVLEQVEQISQNLHDTLESFGEDATLLQQTKHDLPDTAERLAYVIETTEEASNKTLAASENVMALVESLEGVEDPKVQRALSEIQNEMTQIMMAQSFQDLTGQVLNRIILVVGAFEQSLHELIDKAGIDLAQVPDKSQSSEAQKAEEMKGIGPNVTQASKQNSAQSQDDVDDLLSDLGI